MKKHGLLKIIIGILIIVLLIGIAFLVFFFIKGKNPISDIIDSLRGEETLKDNYNGIYAYQEDLNGAKYIFDGCSVSKINYYILIVNDDYYSFKDSCMGTYPLEEGKVKDLDIKETNDNNVYSINYKEHEYVKNNAINAIETNNAIASKLKDIDVFNYELILKETEFEGNYYKITAEIKNLNSKLLFGYSRLDNNTFDITITNGENGEENVVYKYNADNYDNLPMLFPFGRIVAIIEKGQNQDNNHYTYKLKAVNNNGLVYDLDKMFPIVVDGVTLDSNNSVYLKYNAAERNFTLLIGYDDKFCEKDSKSTDKAYYEFRIKYDALSGNFTIPEFVKYGLKNEGCNYIDRIMGGN